MCAVCLSLILSRFNAHLDTTLALFRRKYTLKMSHCNSIMPHTVGLERRVAATTAATILFPRVLNLHTFKYFKLPWITYNNIKMMSLLVKTYTLPCLAECWFTSVDGACSGERILRLCLHKCAAIL